MASICNQKPPPIWLPADKATFSQLPVSSAYAYAGVIDPQLVYLAGGYGGIVAGDEDVLYDGLWQAFRNVQVTVS